VSAPVAGAHHSDAGRPHAVGRGALVVAFASIYLAWGSTYLAIRVALAGFPPPILAGTRFTVAGAGMLAALALAGRPVRLGLRDFRNIAIVGTLLLVGGNGLVVWAEKTVSSGLAALIVATVPLWMALLAALPPAHERLAPRAVVGLGLGMAGVAVLVAPGFRASGTFAAEAALIGATLSWSSGSIFARHTTARIDPILATAWEMLIGGLVFFAIAGPAGSFAALRPTPSTMLAVLYLIVAGSWIGFTAYIWLLAHVPAAKVATYAYVNPVIAVLLGWWILDERISSAVAIGSAIIVVAVVLVTTARVAPARTAVPETAPWVAEG
jgi:drug/metabolite transporter (DMT)-like permease